MRSSNDGRIHGREPLWSRPEFATDLIQILKTVMAATAAWCGVVAQRARAYIEKRRRPCPAETRGTGGAVLKTEVD